MIPIPFPTVVEGVIKQLPQIDFTFGIGDIVGSIALIVSAFTFYISHTQASQSEQIKTSRDIWAGIVEKTNKFNEVSREYLARKEDPDVADLKNKKREMFGFWLAQVDYFAYLILSGEIKDQIVLAYYNDLLIYNVGSMLSRSTNEDRLFEKAPHLDKFLNMRNMPTFHEWGKSMKI